MKKIISTLMLCLLSTSVWAKETITVYFNAGVNQPNYAPYLRMLEIANKNQKKYQFQIEPKPGANGLLAIKAMDQSPENSLATQAPSFVENARSGAINEQDYVAVSAQGDACWAVITNIGDTAKGVASLQGQREITVGGTGFGNVAHLTALTIGDRYGFDVRYIVYKANYDALLNMAAGEKINFVIERVQNYQTFKTRNPNLQILGMSCDQRHPQMPKVKTLAEQGITVPTIFFVTIANVKMTVSKRQEIESILEQAQAQLGQSFLLETADLQPPQFAKPRISANRYFEQRVNQIKVPLLKFQAQIERSKEGN
jgi:tripartite-type tricarboxylate transporter receptor subunit TctC